MSYFSTELQRTLEKRSGSRAAFAQSAGIAASTFHNLYHGENSPTVSELEKICLQMERAERAQLVMAHLRDQVPASARELVRIVSLVDDPAAREEAARDYSDIKLPTKLREDFEFLMRSAVQHPAVGESIASTAKILRGR